MSDVSDVILTEELLWPIMYECMYKHFYTYSIRAGVALFVLISTFLWVTSLPFKKLAMFEKNYTRHMVIEACLRTIRSDFHFKR